MYSVTLAPITNLQLLKWVELPGGMAGQAWHIDTLGDVDGLSELVNVLQWTLDTVKDTPQDTGPQLHGQGLPCTEDGITHGHA